MDPDQIIRDVNAILGVSFNASENKPQDENPHVQSDANIKTELNPSVLRYEHSTKIIKRKRDKEIKESVDVHAEWRFYVLSKSLTYAQNLPRVKEAQEKEHRQLFAAQHKLLLDAIYAQLSNMNESGEQFKSAFALRYQRSIINLSSEPISSSIDVGPRDHLYCSISKRQIKLKNAYSVIVTHRAIGGEVVQSAPIIVSKEWAQRMTTWRVIVFPQDCIRQATIALKEQISEDHVFIAQAIANNTGLFNKFCEAIQIWIGNKPIPGAWPGWWEQDLF